MGGSFSDIGRHNPLEPTLFKKPIVIGPNMSDFVEVIQQLSRNKALFNFWIKGDSHEMNIADDLSEGIKTILLSGETQQALEENAYRVVA
jgi:3-deoxy-D-manno-octulosonic-acid transferase